MAVGFGAASPLAVVATVGSAEAEAGAVGLRSIDLASGIWVGAAMRWPVVGGGSLEEVGAVLSGADVGAAGDEEAAAEGAVGPGAGGGGEEDTCST